MSYQFHMTLIESHNDTPLDSITIDIAKDTKDLHDIHNLDKALQDILSILHSNLKQSFMKEYMYKYVSLQLDSNMLLLILLIPQKIPKIYKEAYKEYHDKEYGVGRYTYLYEYCYHKDLDIKDYAKIGLDSNPSNATILTLHTAYKAQKLEITLANGLDSILESRDRQRQAKLDRKSQNSIKQQSIDSLLTITLINGGYKDKLWGFRENSEDGITILNPKKDFMGAETIRTSIQKSTPQRNKQVHLLFYGGARKIGDNAAFYYASINVLKDYKHYYPNDIFIHEFVDSAKTIVDKINEQNIESIASLDLFFHGSKWGLYMYKGASMYKELLSEDIKENKLNASLYASKTADLLTAWDTHEEKRTIYDVKFDRFISKGAIIEIHGCESGGDLYVIDSISKNLSEEIPQGYVVGHTTKTNPNIDNTQDNTKQDYRHGVRAIWQNGKVIKKTTQKRWINFNKEMI
ncbi:hypothetical protein [Helicobacter bilis]|nr:hypothetical protein [Helicobacter bilis]